MRRSCLLIFLLLMYVPAWGATYYVDATGGNDSNAGTATTQAWKTINKVNRGSFSPGDNILFKRGETWREQLTVPSNGSAGSPITFGAYGSGMNPLINGANLLTGWTKSSSNIYKADLTGNSGPYWPIPNKVWFNNTLGTKEMSEAALTAENEWYWADNVLYVYSTSDPTTAYTSPGIEAAAAAGILIKNKSYITIDGIDVMKGDKGVALIKETANLNRIIVKNGTFSNNGGSGVEFLGTHTLDGGIIDKNILHDNGGSGIYIVFCTNTNIKYNTSYSNGGTQEWSAGIREYYGEGTSGNVIEYNTIYSNVKIGSAGGDGIHIDQVGNNAVIRYNLIHDNDQAGIHEESNHATSDANGPSIYYNVVYHNKGWGIYKQCRSGDDTTGATWKAAHIYNNVAYNNSIGIEVRGDGAATCNNNLVNNNISIGNSYRQLKATQGGENDGTNGSGNDYTYNAFGAEAAGFIEWAAGVTKATYAAFDSAYGSATHSVTTDPLFVSTVTPDFHLKAGSPAINAGTSVGLTVDYLGNAIVGLPDMGAYESPADTTPGASGGGGGFPPSPPSRIWVE